MQLQSFFRHRSRLLRLCCLSTFSNISLEATWPIEAGGGRVVRRCWVNFQCRGVLLICMIVGQGPTALAVGAGGGCLDIFTLVYPFPPLSPSLWETARYRLKYCLKGPLNSKQPTNQPIEAIILGVVGWCDGAG